MDRDKPILDPATLRWCGVQALEAGHHDLNAVYAAEWNRVEADIRDAKRRVYFFGCWERGGHYLHDHYGRSVYNPNPPHPFGYIDGIYTPDTNEVQGPACLRCEDGWTILAWWDRTIDKRSASNAALVAEGEFSFDVMRTMLKERFPKQFKRFPYKNVKYHGATKGEAKR